MKKKYSVAVIILTATLSLACSSVYARLGFEIGTGAVFTGYNDIRVPSDSGTDISLSDELETDPDYFVRVKLTYSKRRHNIEFFASPLRLEATGSVNRQVKFQGEEFSANVPLTALYKFDSYRLTYRYDLINARRLQAGIGFTAGIRDGSISFQGAGKESEKKDTDFEPLINFRAKLVLSRKINLLVEGDILAVSQGRTEDVLFSIQYKLDDRISLKLGYRLFETETDVDEIRNFSLLNYVVIGPILTF